jgi:tetratricopeptide (TPR) repeat protein
MGYYGYLPPEIAMTRASAAAYRALELDPKLSDAHASMGIARTLYYWDWIGAEQAFQKALSLDARSPTAHIYYSLLLSILGRHDEACVHAKRGRDLDPLSLLMHVGVGWAAYFARRYPDAIEAFRAVTAVEPNYPEARLMLAGVHERMGDLERAAEWLGQATGVFGTPPPAIDVTAALKDGLHRDGAAGYYRARTAMFRALGTDGRRIPQYAYLCGHAQLGEHDAAFAILEDLVDSRAGQAAFSAADPALDPLREDSRFERVLRRLALPTPATTA